MLPTGITESSEPRPTVTSVDSGMTVPVVDLYLTGACNLACGYCYGEDDRAPHMDQGTIDCCLEFAALVGASTIELCGGEPTLSPHFRHAVTQARARGFEVILRTNGLAIESSLDLIAAHCSWVGISLDGMPEVNLQMRTPRLPSDPAEAFHRPLGAISALRLANPGIKIMLASVATALNVRDLPGLCHYLVENAVPINRWKIYQFIRDKFRSALNHDRFSLDRPEFDWLTRQIPAVLPNGVDVIFRRSDLPGAGGDCLLIHHDGTVKILGETFGRIGHTPAHQVHRNLAASGAVQRIRTNKLGTYAP